MITDLPPNEKRKPLEPWQIEDAARLKAIFIEKAGMSQEEFGKVFEIGSQGMVWQYLNGKSPLNIIAASKFADGLGVQIRDFSPHWAKILSEAVRDAPRDGANVEQIPARRSTELVPLISWVRAGQWSEVADPYSVGDAEDWKACPVRHGDRSYALKIKGFSMSNPGGKPSFEEGDIIFVDPDREPAHRSLVIVRLDDQNEATFKRLIIDGDSKFLEALNPSWPDRIIKVNGNATFCGVVIARMESYI